MLRLLVVLAVAGAVPLPQKQDQDAVMAPMPVSSTKIKIFITRQIIRNVDMRKWLKWEIVGQMLKHKISTKRMTVYKVFFCSMSSPIWWVSRSLILTVFTGARTRLRMIQVTVYYNLRFSSLWMFIDHEQNNWYDMAGSSKSVDDSNNCNFWGYNYP